MFRIKYCREIVLKILYQADILSIPEDQQNQVIDTYFQTFRQIKPDEEEYVRKMIRIVYSHWREFDETIAQNLIGWKLNRLNPLDRTLLRMGMAESRLSTQKAIIIDDVIRMAKKYGDNDAYKFINAILDKVIA